MCGGGGDGGAADARRREEERQRMIEQANRRIEQTFAPFEGREWAFQPDRWQQAQQQHQRATQEWEAEQERQRQQRMGPFGIQNQSPFGIRSQNGIAGIHQGGMHHQAPFNNPESMTPEARRSLAEQGLIAPLAPDRQKFFGWEQTGNNIYEDAQNQYLDYYLPQIDEQFEDAREQQVYDLANRGLLVSSAAGELQGDLQRDYNRNLDSIRGRAQDFSNDIRSNVAGAKQDLRAMAQSGASPGTVAQTATERARALQQIPAMDPLGDLFGQIGQQQFNRQAARSEGYQPRQLLFQGGGGGSGSGRNVRNVT